MFNIEHRKTKVNDKLRHFHCPVLLFSIRNVLLNRNRFDLAIHMAGFVTSKLVFFYTTNFLSRPVRRQHIFSSFTGLVPVLISHQQRHRVKEERARVDT
jgi:hypothetical protein